MRIDPVDRPANDPRPTYRPNEEKNQIRDAAIAYGDERLAAGDSETALPYYELVADNLPLNAPAASKAGLASLALGQPDAALDWYKEGLERARTTGMVVKAEEALQELKELVEGQPDLAEAAQPILDQLEALR